MSLFNVVQSCVVNGLHYVHPTTRPIEVDDDQAAELLGSGCLTPYPAGVSVAPSLEVGFIEPEQPERPETETPKRGRKPRAED